MSEDSLLSAPNASESIKENQTDEIVKKKLCLIQQL